MESIIVKKPGLLTTVQDLGRRQYQHFGIAQAGAMDAFSLRIANLLVGNVEHEAALEATLVGPELQFNHRGYLAVTGGGFAPKLNGKTIPLWSCVSYDKGDVLEIGAPAYGCRAYLAFAGGIAVPPVLGSKATFLRGKYGGYQGRALKKGDALPIGSRKYEMPRRRIHDELIYNFQRNEVVRFIWGPQDEAFSEQQKELFQTLSYSVSNQSDRMGYRLEGKTIAHREGADIISDFIAPGSIQIPQDGKPIVLMADCQVTGGYTKIGTIISSDLPRVVQKRPGDVIQFQAIPIESAHQTYKQMERAIQLVKIQNESLLKN